MLARRFNSVVKSFRVLLRPNTSHKSFAHADSGIAAIPVYSQSPRLSLLKERTHHEY